jgi:hypothetical protein
MDAILDTIWFKILDFFSYLATLLDTLFTPLNYLGPAFAIFAIAFFTVVITKILTKTIKTKRYEELQKQFVHWFNLRKDALKCEDLEKGKRLARNIDKGKLNQVYYNYFFEGFLLGIATQYLPILFLLAYINEAYKRSNLLKLFGREYVFKFDRSSGEPVLIGAVFWFVISILLIYLGWFMIKKLCLKFMTGKNLEPERESSSA